MDLIYYLLVTFFILFFNIYKIFIFLYYQEYVYIEVQILFYIIVGIISIYYIFILFAIIPCKIKCIDNIKSELKYNYRLKDNKRLKD